MPIYLFWGEDDFAIAKAVEKLRKQVLDPNWLQFNYEKIFGDRQDRVIQAFDTAMTPVFGLGGRLVWLADTTICQHCTEELLAQLQRTLPALPPDSHLLLTTSKKPDKRLKSTKLLQEYAQIQEFSLIPPWETEKLLQQLKQLSGEFNVQLTPKAEKFLAESVGNDTRQLASELEKLQIYGQNQTGSLDIETVSTLVTSNSQNSLHLATAIKEKDEARVLGLVNELLNRNEPALKIVATLVGQFRIWAIVKLMVETVERDEKKIAAVAQIGNPKRIYFLRKEVQNLKAQQLLAILPVLLDLELNLKTGAEPLSTLQAKAIEMCHLLRK
ncbi:MAG: DNA polymerase III subunit delta [Oscillatoria sp. PMC 1051.18]|nr:DNA polymerase III subunit delta [Oscillatoria sp. PMC 1050.18]MEC5029582.1 DNA polymerase III subunit delta [Oscillatoria sp. PMC 1051.18]